MPQHFANGGAAGEVKATRMTARRGASANGAHYHARIRSPGPPLHTSGRSACVHEFTLLQAQCLCRNPTESCHQMQSKAMLRMQMQRR